MGFYYNIQRQGGGIITVFYVDVFLFVHFFFEYILLRITHKIMSVGGGRFRSFFAALFSGCGNVLLLILPIPLWIEYILGYLVFVIIELRIAFPECRMKTYGEIFVVLYALSLTMGGFLKWMYESFAFFDRHGRNVIWLTMAIYFLSLFMGMGYELWKQKRQQKKNLRLVHCEINGYSIDCMGLWDTGNGLYDPFSRKPVLVLEKSELKKHDIHIRREQYRMIPYHSIGMQDGILEAFVADRVRVATVDNVDKRDTIEREKVTIGIYDGKLSQGGKYQIILHPGM